MLKENPEYRSPFGDGVEVEDTTTKNVQNFERVTKIKKVVADTKPLITRKSNLNIQMMRTKKKI